MTMLICIKKHLSNIWISINEKVRQHWDWVEKERCLYKKSVYNNQGINSWNAKVAEQIIWQVSI